MSQTIDIVVPDLGDFTDVEIIEVLVKPGQAVQREDGLITLETDKAAMDVPAPDEGTLEELTVGVGDKVSAGDVIGRLKVESGNTAAPEPAPGEAAGAASEAAPDAAEPAAAEPRSQSVETLVVPELGDFEDVDVIEVHVSEGDEIAVDDAVVTLETDKAAMDVPAVVGGRIVAVLVKAGDKVSEGSQLATIETAAAAARDSAGEAEEQAAPTRDATAPEPPAPEPEPEAIPAKARAVEGKLPSINEAGFARAHASPSVRKLARELGVDLTQVKGSGAKDRVLHDDVKAFVKAVMTEGRPAAAGASVLPATPQVDHAAFGQIELRPLTRIQKISGPRLQASWINLPHVTQHDLADITELEARRQELKGPAKERGISLTPLAFIMKACIAALQEFPVVNSSLGDDGKSLVIKKYYHLGFAADTEQGLMVPVIRDADKKDVYELAAELGELSRGAREGKLKLDQLQGATFTISSLGGIGGTAFTPIVNAPEVAILGVSRSSMQPVWNGTEFEPRLLLPLSLSYDHRVVDGALAVRFTTYLGERLSDVEALLRAIP